jgi:hypothetical protein
MVITSCLFMQNYRFDRSHPFRHDLYAAYEHLLSSPKENKSRTCAGAAEERYFTPTKPHGHKRFGA